MESGLAEDDFGTATATKKKKLAATSSNESSSSNSPAAEVKDGEKKAKEEDEEEPGDKDDEEGKEAGDKEEEEEPFVMITIGKNPIKGTVWKNRTTGDVLKYHCLADGTEYAVGESVYIENQRPDQPYYICQIQELKLGKRDSLNVHIKWFYRTSEVPEQVYQLLSQDRHIENGNQKKRHMNEIMFRTRELFISEMTDIYPAHVLRGKCLVQHCLDLHSVKAFQPDEDAFFYTLSYNPETRRMASTQGETRVGASHQAKLPEYEGDVPVERRPEPWGEEPTWCPERIHDHDLIMFLRAARSMAAFASMCDGGSAEDGFTAATRDSITAQAIQTLHEADYDTGDALKAMVKTPFPENIFRKWDEEDVKQFIRGLKAHGKNFFQIRTNFLHHKETAELIEFYYFWKKTPGAANNRPRGRRHRPQVIRRIKGGKGTNKSSKDDPNELSSCSEPEDNLDAEGRDKDGEMSAYYCRHCYTSNSPDWHHGGKQKLLLCAECREYFKRYAELPNLEGHMPVRRDPSEMENDDEEDEEVDIKKEDEFPPIEPKIEDLKEELNLSSIEQDSKEEIGPLPPQQQQPPEPVAIKADPPKAEGPGGLISPTPTMPAGAGMLPSRLNQPLGPQVGPPQPQAQHPPISVPIASSSPSSDIQVLGERRPSSHPLSQSPQQPIRRDSPPPKPDGSECHRSNSAIFTRMWNRGEGNSCARTDMLFKPVPNSKLARKREDRIRKANEREDAIKNEAAKRAALEQAGLHHAGHPLFGPGDPFGIRGPNPHHRPSPFGPAPPPPVNPLAAEMERRMSMAASQPPTSRPSMYPPGFGPAPPPTSHALAEARRLEDMAARQNAERQYVERMNQLATDPLIRLQMHGVSPEIPGYPSSPYGLLGGPAPPGAPGPGGLRPPGLHGLDQRLRAPNPMDLMLRNPAAAAAYLPGQDMLQRQLIMEREAAIINQHHSAAMAQAAQHEEMIRLEHARQAANR